jgi:metal-dependent amidase/aminoacylase/carboxypeptidase family protein
MFLTDPDLRGLAEWRKALHRAPDLSGEEEETAREVRRFLSSTGPDRIVASLGGHGVARAFEAA